MNTTTISPAPRPTSRNRRAARIATFTVVAAGLLAGMPHFAAEAKTSRTPSRPTTTVPSGPATGRPCPSLGATAHAGRVRFDCVKVGSALQWHPRGSRLNPLDFEEKATVGPSSSRWELTVFDVEDDFTAEALTPDSRNQPPAPGSQYVGVFVRMTYLGPDAQAMVRQGVNLRAFTATRGPIDRAVPGVPLEYDCWVDETVLAGTTKECVIPFEIPTAELHTFGLYAADGGGAPAVYYET